MENNIQNIVENEKNLKVTSIEELKKYASGNLVELPPFAEGQPFVARLKRPSMMVLAKQGKIPNSLLNSANTLFKEGASSSIDSKVDEESMSKLFGVIDILCEASFIEPKYSEIKEAGIELTDEQMLFIFGYSQNGVKQLESFRS